MLLYGINSFANIIPYMFANVTITMPVKAKESWVYNVIQLVNLLLSKSCILSDSYETWCMAQIPQPLKTLSYCWLLEIKRNKVALCAEQSRTSIKSKKYLHAVKLIKINCWKNYYSLIFVSDEGCKNKMQVLFVPVDGRK